MKLAFFSSIYLAQVSHKKRTTKPVKVLLDRDYRFEAIIDRKQGRPGPVRVVLVEKVFDLVGQMIQGVVFGEKKLAAKLFLDIFGDVGPFVRLIVLVEQTYFVCA